MRKLTRQFKVEFVVTLQDTEETGLDDMQVTDIVADTTRVSVNALRTQLQIGQRVKDEGPTKSLKHYEVNVQVSEPSVGLVSTKEAKV